MIAGIGVDIIENSRFCNKSPGFLKKIFTENEIKEGLSREAKEEYFASRFASKEAFVKAMGTGFGTIQPKDIEVFENADGLPAIVINKEPWVKKRIHLSLSHEKGYSVAMVVLEDV